MTTTDDRDAQTRLVNQLLDFQKIVARFSDEYQHSRGRF